MSEKKISKEVLMTYEKKLNTAKQTKAYILKQA